MRGKEKWYALIPLSLSFGIGLGWLLSHIITDNSVNAKTIASKMPQCPSRDKVHEAILAIDDELNTEKNEERRKVLVDTSYRLRDLELRSRLKKSPDPICTKTSSPISQYAFK